MNNYYSSSEIERGLAGGTIATLIVLGVFLVAAAILSSMGIPY